MDENKIYGTRSARLWKLFLSTLYISSFTFGGGFVIVTFMKKKFVDELHWIDEQEMLDMTALAQSSPGAIAVNAAILVGWQVEGLIGMIVAVLGTIIPPYDHSFCHFCVLQRLCCQSLHRFAAQGNASRRSGGHSGCGIRPRRQGAEDPLMGVYCPDGRSVCRQYSV